jgi:hypothetical protein
MSNTFRHIFYLFILLLSFSGRAQDTLNTDFFTPQFDKDKYYQITTVYGTQFRGTVIEETRVDITLLDKRSDLKHKIIKSDIKEVKPIGISAKDNISRFDDDYYSNYYMLSENALPFKEGAVTATTHYFVENIHYAFNENWSVSLNVLLFLPASVGVKCSFEISRNLYFGANAYVWALPDDNMGNYQIPFMGMGARVTKGDDNTNFTIGVGGVAIKNFDNTIRSALRTNEYYPVYFLNFGYTSRFAKHGAFNIENFLFPQAFAVANQSINLNLTGFSIKWIRDTGTQWNFGCYGMYLGDLTKLNSNSKVLPIPYLSYTQFIR